MLWLIVEEVELSTILLLALASGIISVLLAGWLLRRKLSALPRSEGEETLEATQLLRTSLPILATNLINFLSTQAPLWVVGVFLVQQQVALYGSALKLVILVAIPLVIVNAVVSPLIAELYSQGRTEELERALRGTATVAGIPALAVFASYAFLGAPILSAVYGDYYSAAFPILALLSLGHLVNVWSGSCRLTLIMTGYQGLLMWITIVSGAFAVGGAVLAANYSGTVGVAAVVAAVLAIQNISIVMVTRAMTGMWTHVGFSGFLTMIRMAGWISK